MAPLHCSRAYRKNGGETTHKMLTSVQTGIFGHPFTFAKPPIASGDVDKQKSELYGKTMAYEKGGEAQKPDYEIVLGTSIKMLDVFADYVDGIANGDKNIIELAGFKATAEVASQSVRPAVPQSITLTRGTTGIIKTECETYGERHTYGCVVADGPLPTGVLINPVGQLLLPKGAALGSTIVDVNQSRKKQFEGLVPGTVYYVYYFVANAAGVSGLSVAQQIMCV